MVISSVIKPPLIIFTSKMSLKHNCSNFFFLNFSKKMVYQTQLTISANKFIQKLFNFFSLNSSQPFYFLVVCAFFLLKIFFTRLSVIMIMSKKPFHLFHVNILCSHVSSCPLRKSPPALDGF